MISALFCLKNSFIHAVYGSPLTAIGSSVVIDGFSWAENLVFDGNGNMFVSENTRGELWRIYRCIDGKEYCKEIHASGFKSFGGLACNGTHLYAGATFLNMSFVILSLSISAPQEYSILIETSHQANGLAVDWYNQMLYFTYENFEETDGDVISVNIQEHTSEVVATVMGADGAWFDETNRKLFIGELLSMYIHVFSVSPYGLVENEEIYPGPSETLTKLSMLDDFTLEAQSNIENMNETTLIGTDYSGKQVVSFQLGGGEVSPLDVGELVLHAVTSVRWGRGPGFDEGSLYVTEGGGISKEITNRRVIQIKMR